MTTENVNKQADFESLKSLKLNRLVKKKGNFDYLSWAHAWEIMKKNDPKAKVEVREYEHHKVLSGQHQDFLVTEMKPYMIDSSGAYVTVDVTLNFITESETMPVLDYRNQPVIQPNAMQINSATKRCFVKALALHGVGLYIYQGEDIPTPPRITEKQLTMLDETLTTFFEEKGEDVTEDMVRFVNKQTEDLGLIADQIKSFEEMTVDQLGILNRQIAQSRKKLNK